MGAQCKYVDREYSVLDAYWVGEATLIRHHQRYQQGAKHRTWPVWCREVGYDDLVPRCLCCQGKGTNSVVIFDKEKSLPIVEEAACTL